MKIVADENVDKQIVDRLRADGHEVLRRRRGHGRGIEAPLRRVPVRDHQREGHDQGPDRAGMIARARPEGLVAVYSRLR